MGAAVGEQRWGPCVCMVVDGGRVLVPLPLSAVALGHAVASTKSRPHSPCCCTLLPRATCPEATMGCIRLLLEHTANPFWRTGAGRVLWRGHGKVQRDGAWRGVAGLGIVRA